MIYYLDTDKHLPKITSFLKMLCKLFFFFSLSSPFLELTLIYEIASIFSTLFLLIITIYLTFIKKLKLAFFILISELILITGNLFMFLADLALIDGSFFTDYFYIWGASVEVILMSLALSYKYNILEKQRTLEEQKRKETETILIDKQKLFSIGENFNNLVHQFRQPLSQINSIVYLIYANHKKNNLNDKIIEENLDHIESQTSHLSKTLEYFRNFTVSKEENKIFLLASFIEKVEVLMEFVLKTNHIILEKEFDETIRMNTDETQLLQIFYIIITNAKDAFVENSTEEPKIRIKAHKEKNNLSISISNNACEINPLIINKIFEPYFTTKNNSDGTGLGLYIIKLIIEDKLNSSIKVKTENGWTNFTMELKDITL